MLTNELFNEFFQSGMKRKEVQSYPPTDISYYEDSELVFIEVALAGFKKEYINIKTEGNALVISSDGIPDNEDEKEVEYIQRGIAKRSFKRVVKLDDIYVHGEISASMEDGLLTVCVKPSKKRVNKIEIK